MLKKNPQKHSRTTEKAQKQVMQNKHTHKKKKQKKPKPYACTLHANPHLQETEKNRVAKSRDFCMDNCRRFFTSLITQLLIYNKWSGRQWPASLVGQILMFC